MEALTTVRALASSNDILDTVLTHLRRVRHRMPFAPGLDSLDAPLESPSCHCEKD